MISITHLDFSFKKKIVFKNLNLTLHKGQTCALLGKNGTGKTTLLQNIAGLLYPKNGEITVYNHIPAKREPSFLQQIFIVPEDFSLPKISIQQYLNSQAVFYPLFDENMFNHYLKVFEIPVKNKLHEMSYGQKKKVLISFALSCNAKIILLDEPTNGLDIQSKAQFKKVITEITDDEKIILISTHQVKDMENLIDRIIMIDETKVIFDENMDNIAQKLQFKLSFDKQEIEESIYAEESIIGNAVILLNTENRETKIDLEMLYKAVIMQPSKINQIFNAQLN